MTAPHARYVRYREFERIRHSTKMLQFLSDQAARLAALVSDTAGTTASATDQILSNSHGLVSGAGPYLVSGTAPGGTDNTTPYFIGVVDDNNFTLHLTEAEAIAASNPVDITQDATAITLARLVDQEEVFSLLKAGNTAEQVEAMSTFE